MNEFTAKKLGEVLAFAEVGKETMEKGLVAFSAIYGSDKTAELIEEQNGIAEQIRIMAEEQGVSEVVLKKLDSTGAKLRAMRDLYVGDQWDNPTELLEWSGFFEGAAVVHWSLVRGAAEGINLEELAHLSTEGFTFHHDLLSASIENLRETGERKAQEN